MVGTRGNLERRELHGHASALASTATGQEYLSIQTVHALIVRLEPFALEQDMKGGGTRSTDIRPGAQTIAVVGSRPWKTKNVEHHGS